MQRFVALFLLTLLALVAVGCGSDDDADSGEPGQADGADGEWVLESLVLEGDMAIPLPDRPLNLRIGGSEIGGDAGCNSMGGTAVFDSDGSVEVSELFWTEMACAEVSLMDFERQYTQAIGVVTRWSIVDAQLTLQGPGVQTIYVRRVAPPDLPIIDTRWTLDTFLEGDAAMNAAGMQEVSLVFSDSGVQVSGRCWTISGFATVEPGGEGNLTTDFSSADPGFTCDDRSFFADMLDRLALTTEYRIDENRLTLGNGEGDVVSLRG